MEILRAMLCAFLVVSVTLSKPVCLNCGGESSESSDSDSSEEAPQSTQPELGEPEVPSSMEETDPPEAAAPLPSAETDPTLSSQDASPSALPDTATEDPQTSTDIDPLSLVLESDPSQSSLGMEISQDVPETDPSHDAIGADVAHVSPDTLAPESSVFMETVCGVGTERPHIKITTFQGFPQGAATPLSPDIVAASPRPAAATAAVPVCFTLHITTPAPPPSRGDSV